MGIAIYNMRQGEDIRYETLFRDETVGALDAANAKEYVRMLRRAIELGGFHQVIFICHTPLVWELADRILSVGDGRVQSGNSEDDVVNNGGDDTDSSELHPVPVMPSTGGFKGKRMA